MSSNGKFVRVPQSALRDACLISGQWYKDLARSMPDEKRPVFLENAKLKTLNVPLPQTSPKQGIARRLKPDPISQ